MTPAADRLYPLTSPQREIWFDQLLHDGIPLYNIGGYVKLPGAIDPVLFEHAANLLVQKHDTLRTLLVQERDEDGIPLQTFADTLSIKVPMHDFSDRENPHEAAIEWMQARFREPFELMGQPLFRYDLVKLREDCYYWLLQYHHLIVDGYAVALLNRSLAAIYTQLATGQVPNLESPSYTTFIDYDRAYVASETFETQRQYWLNKYPTRPEPLFRARSPASATATATAQVIGSSCEVLYLPRDFYNRLKTLAKQHHATLFHLLLGALYVYFTRTAQRDDLAIGLPVLNRANAQFKHTAGLFTGVSPTWFQFGQELSFAELLQQINQTLKANYRHQRFPVSEINRAVSLGAARSQLFEINLSYENHDNDASFAGIEGQLIPVLHHYEQTPLIIFVRDFHLHQDIEFDFVFNLAYFNADDIKTLQARFVTILEAVLKDSVLPIYTLPVMTALEVQQLRAWNDTAVAYPTDLTLVDLFEQQVAKTPENLAVVFETQSLTYRQLNEKANQLAHYLLDLTTFKKLSNLNGLSSPNPLIAIAVERSLEMVIGLLGILKAGGAYVPIDPSYPAARIHYMLEDSAAPLLLTQSHLKAQLSLETLEHECVVVCLEEATWAGQPTENPQVSRQATDLAYVIYTSGSTGKPKGVSLPQVALVNLLLWQSQQPSLAPPANTLQFTTLSFDVSCQEIFSTWLTGGQLVLVAEETRRDASALFNYLSSRQIERLFVPMVMLQLLAEQQAVSNLEALRLQNIITAGEQLRLTPAITAWFQTLPQCRLHNHYGPTESHVVTALTLPVATETWTPLPPIGQPIANVRIYLLDQNHQPQPPGVPGELCIAGAGLARGYLNRPDLTAAKFIEVELFGQTERIYKTGDLARWRPDGNLEYLGRLDHQVKLRGFRIELGEIEAVLSQHAAVKEAVVTLYEADDNKRLVAYLTTDADSSALVTTLKDWLTARLPDYMIPSQFTVLEKLPLTPNGKIDRQALPAPVLSTLLSTPPVTPTEDLLASLWAGVLKREAINREDNFFELGGHSLLATQLIARIRESFQVELPVRAIFEHPQLSSLATAIAAATGTVRLPPIEVQPANAPQLLSFAQQRLWFLSQLEENHRATYNMPVALRLTGNLKVEALQQSLRWLLERHTSLRSAFPTQDGRATVQILDLESFAVLTIQDLRSLLAVAQSEEVQTRANRHALAPFELAQGPLFKAELLLLNEQESVLLLNWHHIISDGWSMGVFVRDWQHAYTALAQGEAPSLPALPLQYGDYAAWQRHWLQGEVLQQQVDYWQQQLAGVPSLLELPTDKPRPAQQSYHGAHYSQRLSPTLTAAITSLNHQHGVTVFMTLLTTFYILLSRYSRQADLCVGSPIANRTHRQTEDLIGFFVNTLVLRAQLQPQQSFLDLLRATRQTCLAAYAHQDLPFEMLVEQLQPTRSLSQSPLFQVMFVLQNNEPVELTLPDLEITALTSDYPIAKFDLTLSLAERDGQWHGEWEYATDLFAAETIERMAGHFEVLLTAIVANPTQTISHLPMLTESEVQQLRAWNDTAVAYPQNLTLVDLFEQQVAKTPENLAVVFEAQSLTYRQLNAKANQLAHYLLDLTTFKKLSNLNGLSSPNPLIAIAVERSLEMVIGLLGILKAGGAYVPIDPSYPAARIHYMLADSAAPLLLTQSHLRAQLSLETLEHECVVVCLEEATWAGQATVNPLVSRHATDLAYVIYTSGSTGKPKGVMIESKSLVNLALAQIHTFRLCAASRVLQFASFSFDASVSEITTTFLSGATLYLVPKARLLETAELTALMVQQQISHLTLPPSVLSQFSAPALSGLNTLVVAGETCPAELVKQWANQIRVINAYGPTESTVCASMALCGSEMDTPPIGQPIANTRIYILDAHHQPQPPGVPGELCIAGAGLARGYHNRPDLTAEKFIEVELFGQTERIYKTGDLARWRPDGNLEYLGRLDHQVKLRGFRIELGEIEAVLSQHAAVKEAVVTLYEADDNKRLVAYLTTDADSKTLVTELKDWLTARLPDYMIPSQFTVLEKLPLTPNGKLDRQALPAPEWRWQEAYEAPRNDREQQLAQIWSRLLKQTNLSIHDNFFEVGGDSILSIQIVAQARQAGLLLTPRDLFQHQTIADLATVVRVGVATVAEPGLVTGEVPLTPIQQWFFAQALPEPWHFNQSILLQVPADLKIDVLREALAAVLSHHDALRLRYHPVAGHWQQSFSAPTNTVPVFQEDLNPAADLGTDCERVTQRYQTRLHLSDGPLTQLVFLKWGEAARLFWCIHHLVVDGVSWRILQEDLQTAYTHLAAGQRPQLPAKTSSFKAWAERLASYAHSEVLAAERAYWQALPTIALPVANPTGENRLEQQRHETITLSHHDTEALLREVPVAYNTRINDVLLTALALTLAEWTGKPRCLIDLEGHGRVGWFEDLDLSRTVGWFTTIHPVALTLPNDTTDLGAALKTIKEQLRAIPQAGIGYGLLTQRGDLALPKGEILFNYLGQFDLGTAAAGFDLAPETTGSDISLRGERDHLIDINGAITQGQLRLTWSYSGECSPEATIKTLADRYQSHLQHLIHHCQRGKQGVTPSDFPLAQLTPATLDALYARYAGLQDLYPLSPMQQGMLFHTLYEPATGVYFEQMQWTLSNLDPTAFQAAWQHQLERHPILRSAFVTDHHPLLQVVLAKVPLRWREQDWRGLPPDTQQSQLETLLLEERTQGFDLSEAPLMRFDLIRWEEQRYVFIQHHHHLLMDGWCLPITVSEVRDSYRAYQQGHTPQLPPRRPYREYIAWLQQQDPTVALQYWQQRLAGLASPTPLPIITPRIDTPVYREARYALDTRSTQQLQRFGQTQRVTLNTLVQGAWALLLSRYSRESDVCVGVTVSGRQVPVSGLTEMMGLFINTLPLRVAVNPHATVTEYLQQLQTQHQNDQRYAQSPLFEIQKGSEVPNGTALFESLLVFENYPLGEVLESPADSFQIEDFQGVEYTNYPLTVAIVPGESLHFTVSYDSRRLHPARLGPLWGHLQTLLLAFVDHPTQAISHLPMLTAAEVQQLRAWNDTAVAYPQDLTLVDLFEQQVAKTPENLAVVFETQSLTYRQLNEKANQLAHYLLDLTTFKKLSNLNGLSSPNPLIAIAVERSLEMVIGLLGILKAGGAYVPIDPSYPAARIRYLLEDSAAPWLLTQSHLKAPLSLEELEHECVVVCLEEATWAGQPTENPQVSRQVTDLAYVIYTSGSTGVPKGAMNTHTGIVNRLWWMQETYRLTVQDRILQKTPVSFDVSVWELFWPLLTGAGLIVAKPAGHQDPVYLAAVIASSQVTVLHFVPAMLAAFLSYADVTNCRSLKRVICSGEALSVELVQQFWTHFADGPIELHNLYGPTEAAVDVSYWSCQREAIYTSVPIGKPVANTQLYVLDANHQVMPIGVPGELYIGGIQVGRGYLNRPDLTAAKFIEVELFGQTERIYKTGDLARWRPDGNLEYLGRLDHQVKLRGFRIELGEIEAVLSQHAAVKEAVVTLYEADDHKRLVAYLTTDADSSALVTTLKDWLTARLPDYMIPSQFTVLEKLPLTPNGKIDRQALPAPVLSTLLSAPPVTPTEDLLASLWAGVLKREAINREDNFFELGGHSLLATQLIARIRESFQVELPVRAVFEHPQLSSLATAIAAATGTVRLPPIEVQPAEAPRRLSFAQQRLWFLTQLEENKSATYNMPVALRLTGNLKVEALQQSLRWLLERHTSLRSTFPTQDGRATVQILDLESFAVLTIQDLRSRSVAAQSEEVQTHVNRHALAPFELAQGPLFKAELLLLNEQESVLLLNWHHIISDGWSLGVFVRDWQQAYTALTQSEASSLPALPLQYGDYAAWQRQWLQGEVLQQQVDYWQQQLAGTPSLLELPTDKPRPAQQSYHGAHYSQRLSPTLTAAITSLSHQHGVTVFMTLLTTFYILLSRYSRQEDVCVGSPIANRTHRQTEDLIGFFVNTLVLRAQLQPQQSFLDLLQATRRTCLAAYAHQDIPFEMLVEQLQPTRSLSQSPLFQVMFVLQNNEPVELTLPDLEITALTPDYPIAKFDLTLSLEERDGQWHGEWEYATDLFAAETIERMAGHFEVLLTAVVSNPTQTISHLPMLTVAEVQQLRDWNDTTVAYPQDLTLVDLFEQQVAKTPENLAVVFEAQSLTYRQLNAKANQLAHYLLDLTTFKKLSNLNGLSSPNPLIAIAVERSLEMVIGLLGILKAGGAYVPLDPSYPAARIHYMLADSAAPLLLTQSHLKAQLSLETLEHECVVVCLEEATWAGQATVNPLVSRHATDLAYVIYTSGSTGKPKGVMVEHSSVVNLLLAFETQAPHTIPLSGLFTVPFSFDLSVWEIFSQLCYGGALHVLSPEKLLETNFLVNYLLAKQISSTYIPPTFLELVAKQLKPVRNPLQRLLVGVEPILQKVLQVFRTLAEELYIINGYGPTEATVCATFYQFVLTHDGEQRTPIGKPVANYRIYILNADNQPQPPGVPGELCIAGAGLARGYLNRPDLTAAKFIEVELFGQTERIYKTGDLARWRPDGNLEYLGRLDHQVKLRGFRIELGEIEAVLSQHQAVKEAVVTLYEADDHKRLVAYLTTDADSKTLVTTLKDWLTARLPDYMIPSQFTVLEKLPLTPNGKLDRQALPAPVLSTLLSTPPVTPTEDLLASLWAGVLKREAINREDNFFELGGHSLLATQLIARIRESFQVELPVRAVFEHPQLSSLATAIAAATGTVRLPPIEVQPANAPQLLSFAQQRLWFLSQLEENHSATYNMPVALRLTGNLKVEALQQSLRWLLERHTSLRSAFPTQDGRATVQILDLESFAVLTIQDLRSRSAVAQSEEVQTRANRHALAPFELAQGPLFKAELLLLNEQESVLLLNWHHIISDGWSMGVFVRDWQHAYTALAQGEAPSLPALPLQYGDYAAWQRQWLQGEVLQQQVDYWQQQLAGVPALLELPTAKPRPAQQSYHGAHYPQRLSPTLTAAITSLSHQHAVTVFMTLLTTFYILLSRYSRQADLCVGSPIANRTHRQTEDLIGFFVNTLVLRAQLQPQQSFLDLLRATRQTCLAAYAHQDLPFEMLVEQLQPTRSLSQSPLFQVMFVLQNNEPVELTLPDLEITALTPDYPIAKFDLTLSLEERDGQWHGEWEYATDLFAAETIERLAGHFEVLLTAVVANPTQAISHLPMLTESEVQQLRAWNDTAVAYPQNLTLVDLFEQQVSKTPDNLAVVFETQSLTYRQLNEKANQLAHYLLDLTTFKKLSNLNGLSSPNPLIAIAVERSLEMVIGLLGILKAGGAYVPIDPSYPAARIRYLLEDSAAPWLLTQSHLKAPLSLEELEHECVVVCLEEVTWAGQPTENPQVSRQVTDLAYVIYTSGSTGKPKGVMIEQASVINLSYGLQKAIYALEGNSQLRVSMNGSLAFDTSVKQLIQLLQGHLLNLIPDKVRLEKEALLAYLLDHQIDVFDCTPSQLSWFLSVGQFLNSTSAPHTILVGGEALDAVTWQQLQLSKTKKIYNVYGPTECTVDATIGAISTAIKPIIGRPIANTQIYLLDANHQLTPLGVSGELCIAGAGLARGYLNRPDLTAAKFIEVELFGQTERIYKTGDLARWCPDGNLEYLGRLDHQVKLRGFRIELGEIEAVLSQHAAVKEAVVTLYEADDHKRLVAYLTTDADSKTLVTTLKDWLTARLPDYMIPSHFIVLEKLPLTPNGKLDRQALPAPVLSTLISAPPVTPTEDLLASLWARVLKHEAINREDNFFELGGHSLLATQLIVRIRESFQVELPVRAVFEHPQLSSLATAIAAATGTVRLPPIEVQPAEAPRLLSFAQQRLWFLTQLEENESATYNMPVALRLTGNLKVEALQQSLRWLLERHTSLRSAFPTQDGRATVQILDLESFAVLTIQDLRSLLAVAQSEDVQTRINRHALTPFELAQGPLFKAELLLLNEQESVLLLNWHHIISDGWSMGVFVRDWQHAYTALAQGEAPSLPPLLLQYSDYAAWQRHWLQGEVLQQQVDYWHQQLAGVPALLELPTTKPRPAQQSYHGAHYSQRLSPTLTAAITTLSHQHGVTVFMTLLTTFYILLSRYSRQTDVCVGSPIANRTHRQTEDLIGFFVNTLVLRAQLQPQQSFLDLLQATRQTCLAAYAHQDLPFEMLVEQLQPTRSLSHSPLFQVMFVLQNNEPVELTLPDLEITALSPNYPIAKFDLTLSLAERDGQWHGEWEYATDLFAAETIERMAGHFEVLLTAVVANPTQTISHLPMLTVAEVQQLRDWNDTAVAYPQDLTLVDLFEQQVSKTPDNLAVVFETQSLTYRQLNEKANQLAHYLLDLTTFKKLSNLNGLDSPNPLIAIAVERSLEMVIGLLGILKAGGAYVPIDPSYPTARIHYMLEDSAAPWLLTQTHLQAPLSLETLEHDCVVVCLEEATWAGQPTENPLVNRQVEDLVYVIYTSGSTGLPKGVQITHRSLVNFLTAMRQQPGLTSHDTLLAVTTLSFDIAGLELYLPLLVGAKLVIVSREVAADGIRLLAQLNREAITVMQATPATWQLLVAAGWQSSPQLKILCGGEALSPLLASQLLAKGQSVWNLYGPTETTIWSTVMPLQAADLTLTNTITIGRPLANTSIYILDKQLQLVPVGVPGELYIGGAGLARGYLNRPELTAAKFIEVELFGQTERIYKTGDLARWRPDGNLEYLGRLDHQVKLRGFRIELGEIEAVLSQHQAVKEAVVTLYEADDNKRLVAYLTTDADSKTLVTALKDWLTARLPDYMIPSHFIVLEKLPLTPNGKLDRQALPAPDTNTLAENTLPRDVTELQLLGVWETVLGVHPLGIHDNFFDLGGHSLLAVKLMSHIQQQFAVRLPVSALFQTPTVATLAPQLRQDTTPRLTNLVPIQPVGEANPVYGLPGAIGSVMYFYPLASALGSQQPFYALSTPGLDGSPTPETVEALAYSHLQALRQHQPTGPYQLIGHSSGGRVAFEMAWQLEQQGETVAFLAILDTTAPDSNQPNPSADYTVWNWLSDLVLVFEELTGIDLNRSLEYLQALPDLDTAYVEVMQAFQQRQLLFAPGASVAELQALVNTYRITIQGHASYQLPGQLRSPIHLFRASERQAGEAGEDNREAWGWAAGTHAQVTEHWVPGTHVTMMTSPHVQTLAELLSQSLLPGKRKDFAG